MARRHNFQRVNQRFKTKWNSAIMGKIERQKTCILVQYIIYSIRIDTDLTQLHSLDKVEMKIQIIEKGAEFFD